MQNFPSLYIFVQDVNAVRDTINDVLIQSGETDRAYVTDYYGFDLACDEEQQAAIYKLMNEQISKQTMMDKFGMTEEEVAELQVSFTCAALEKDDFLVLNSGFFALGLILGLVFICGAVLIMYYKQIIEGYEDQSRFEILQKVGMTKQEIRKSINSQVLTVFFAPLIMSGIHMGFAFPLISKLLMLFGLMNTRLLIMITLGCFFIFAAFYILVYLGTSRAYYGIVSENNLD